MPHPPEQPDRPAKGPAPILVLGLGNILLRDEGIGVRVVQAMEGMALPPGVELFDGATAGLDLVDVIIDRRKVVVIDAMDALGVPGTVLRLLPEDLAAATGQSVSLHDMGLLEALMMARHMGREPREVVILAVKPGALEWGLELSDGLKRLVPKLIELVVAELETPSACGCAKALR